MNPEDGAFLHPVPVTTAQERSACITLADRALIATGWTPEAEQAGTWDREAAKTALRQALELIGAVPYESAPRKPHFGQRREAS